MRNDTETNRHSFFQDNPMKSNILISDKLILSPVVAGDWKDFTILHSNPKVMINFDKGNVLSVKESKDLAQAFYKRWLAGDYLSPFAIRTINGAFLGFINLRHESCIQPGHIELGYIIAEQYWHQGVATEAASMIMNYIKKIAATEYTIKNSSLNAIIATASPENEASIRLLIKLGFIPIGSGLREGKQKNFYVFPIIELAFGNLNPENLFLNVSSSQIRAKL